MQKGIPEMWWWTFSAFKRAGTHLVLSEKSEFSSQWDSNYQSFAKTTTLPIPPFTSTTKYKVLFIKLSLKHSANVKLPVGLKTLNIVVKGGGIYLYMCCNQGLKKKVIMCLYVSPACFLKKIDFFCIHVLSKMLKANNSSITHLSSPSTKCDLMVFAARQSYSF